MKTSRRVILKGLGGVTVALPWLEGLAPRASAQGATGPEPFAIFVRQGNGIAQQWNNGPLGSEPERFWPTTGGALTSATMTGRAVEPLIPYRTKLLMVKNTRQGGQNVDNVGCGHARGGLACLTGQGATPASAGAGVDALANGESLDHRIGRELNPGGRDSLALLARSNSSYLNYVLTYSGPGVRRSPITDPWVAYQTVFGSGGGGMTNEALERLRQRRMSVNDLVRGQLEAVRKHPRLSANDVRRLDLHQTNIRDLEVSLTCGYEETEAMRVQSEAANPNVGDGATVARITKLHMDVAVLAVACGYTRSVAIQVGNGNDQTRYMINGSAYERFHWISHRRQSDGSDGELIAGSDVMHHEIDKLIQGFFAHLVGKLDAYPVEGGTLLDRGMAVYTNDLGNAAHSANQVPWIIAGGANGYLKQGQFVDAANVTHNRLLNTIGAAVGLKSAGGAPLNDFGDPTLPQGELDLLKA